MQSMGDFIWVCSELPTANINNCTGTVFFCVVTYVALHWDHFMWWQTSWCCPLSLFAVSCPDVIVDCITVNMRFLLHCILYGFGIGFLWLMYTHYIYQHVHYMLNLLVKLRMLHFACFIHIIFSVRIITVYVTLWCAMYAVVCIILVILSPKAL